MTDRQHIGSGLLVVDKPQGVTSHDVVAAVRSKLHMKRVGHAGTLDPMATGVLVIGFGYATRLLNYIVEHNKTYETTITLGRATTTDDAEGEFVDTPRLSWQKCIAQLAVHGESDLSQKQELDVAQEKIRRVISEQLTGVIEQVPSTFSAIKVDGKRAYDLAREGQEVALQARTVNVSEFNVHRVHWRDYPDTIDVEATVTCSAGTYIRALARDLGELLGVGGYLTRLRRTRVGDFSLETANNSSEGLGCGSCADHSAPSQHVQGCEQNSNGEQNKNQIISSGSQPIISHTVVANTREKTFVNREGEHISRTQAVLNLTQEELLERAYSMLEGVRLTMDCLAITEGDARELRFGRSIRLQDTDFSANTVDRTNADRHMASDNIELNDVLHDVEPHNSTSGEGDLEKQGKLDFNEIAYQHAVRSTNHANLVNHAKLANTTTFAAYVHSTGEVVAIVRILNGGEAKPVVVFPSENSSLIQ